MPAIATPPGLTPVYPFAALPSASLTLSPTVPVPGTGPLPVANLITGLPFTKKQLKHVRQQRDKHAKAAGKQQHELLLLNEKKADLAAEMYGMPMGPMGMGGMGMGMMGGPMGMMPMGMGMMGPMGMGGIGGMGGMGGMGMMGPGGYPGMGGIGGMGSMNPMMMGGMGMHPGIMGMGGMGLGAPGMSGYGASLSSGSAHGARIVPASDGGVFLLTISCQDTAANTVQAGKLPRFNAPLTQQLTKPVVWTRT